MSSFSQRMGLAPATKLLQVKSLDNELRNRLWNAVYTQLFCIRFRLFERGPLEFDSLPYDAGKQFFYCLWNEYFKKSIDDMPQINYGQSVIEVTKIYFFKALWNEAYDLLEFVVKSSGADQDDLITLLNKQLEEENSGYRFVGSKIVPITDNIELESVNKSLEVPFGSARIHFQKSIEHFSVRKNPDYRNCIKESISAVEAVCQEISGNKSASLGECLNTISKKHPLHGALKSALSSLYGYTSDGDGIRHALTDESSKVSADDAKFMLVSCSAFVNFLVALCAKYNIDTKS